MRFIDGPKFGGLWLAEDPAVVLLPLSPEPLEGEFTTEWLAASLAGRNAPVEALLPGLSIAAGLGNPYADESLFLSGIPFPLRPCGYGGITKRFRRRRRGLR